MGSLSPFDLFTARVALVDLFTTDIGISTPKIGIRGLVLRYFRLSVEKYF